MEAIAPCVVLGVDPAACSSSIVVPTIDRPPSLALRGAMKHQSARNEKATAMALLRFDVATQCRRFAALRRLASH